MSRAIASFLLLLSWITLTLAVDYTPLLREVDAGRLQRTLTAITTSGSRLAGSEGERLAFAYASGEFRRLCFRLREESFSVTVPGATPATITSGTRSAHLDPLWPNLIRTSTTSVTGRVVLGRSGSLDDLSGKPIKGSIVVLDFDSGAAWTNAAALGAAAIIFERPKAFTRWEAEAKFKSTPLDVPRFLISPGADLRNGEQARLQCRQDWQRKQSRNLVADIAGTDPSLRNQPVVIFAYADAMSVAPGDAPGAQQGCGLAAALELAEIWARRPHRRPLRIVVSGAHCLNLQGAREYIQRRFIAAEESPVMVATLDLSTGSKALGVFGRGYAFNYRDEILQPVLPLARVLRAHAEELTKQLGESSPRIVLTDAANHSDNRSWKNNIPGTFAFDCEPFMSAGYNAVTFATIDDARSLVDTPSDTMSRLDVSNLHRQVQVLNVMFRHLLNDDLSRTGDNTLPLELREPRRISLVGGFATAEGYVAVYDPTRSLVPNLRVPESLAVRITGKRTLMGVRGDEVQLTAGADAGYRFIGLPPQTAYATRDKPLTTIQAFHVVPTTGAIDYATDQGAFGADTFPITFALRVAERRSPIVVFPCAGTNLFGLTDPQDFSPLDSWSVLDPRGGAAPQSFALARSNYDALFATESDDTAVLFLAPKQSFQLLMGTAGAQRLILTNSTAREPAGAGYSQAAAPSNVAIAAASDLCAINEARVQRFGRYRMLASGVVETHREAQRELEQAKASYAERRWAKAAQHARAAWALALRAHPVLQGTASDVVNGVIFYSFLLIPFSYFIERLLFAGRSLTKQLFAVTVIFAASFGILRVVHPAFDIVSNPMMIFVGFVVGALSLIVSTFIVGKFENSLREGRQVQSGIREIDVRRANVATAAISLGVSNLRRRKTRTFLTTLTLVVMTFIVLSFTSIVPELQVAQSSSPYEATYPGLLLRDPGLERLPTSSYHALANEFEGQATVSRRVFSYGADMLSGPVMSLERHGIWADADAMMGVDASESEITRPQLALVSGRWFQPGERAAIILPGAIADKLEARVGDSVTFMGEVLNVVGIYDSERMKRVRDLDGESILPPDFGQSRQKQAASGSQTRAYRKFIRLDPSVCFLLPAETALALGGDVRSVAVGMSNPARSRAALFALMPRLRLNLYGSVPSSGGMEVRQFSVLQGSKSSGLGLVVIQLLIASVFVLNTMIASVYERTRELSIFSAIGLAPNHIATLFFAEAAVYGVLGSVIGYFCAQGAARIIVSTGAFPALTLNFSSTSAIASALLVLGVVLGSAIYPARKAAQIAAPAMADTVEDSRPEGDDWVVILPFSVPEAEADPVLRFLADWLRGHEGYTVGEFVTESTEVAPLRVQSVASLAPYDLGVTQQIGLRAAASPIAGAFQIELTLRRVSGETDNWIKTNRRFLTAIRRQFLRWRTLSDEERAKFA